MANSEQETVKINEAKWWKNKWFKFAIASFFYILIFVIWTERVWPLVGLVVIFDVYISKLMYKHVWRHNKAYMKKNKSYKFIMEWVEAIVFATIVASLIGIYIFKMYVIPTSSMEKTLLVGDYLCVSKVAYGPTMPNTPISFPFVHHTMPLSQTKRSFSEAIKWPYHRLKGWGDVKRGDVVVFNFPAGDTVLLENQAVTYYDVLRQFQREYGDVEGRKALEDNFTIISRPVDKRENYIKRCVGIAGDTLHLIDGQLYVNSDEFTQIPELQFNYYIRTNGTPISRTALEEMGIANDDVAYNQTAQIYDGMPLTAANLERVKSMRNVTEIIKYTETGHSLGIFPQDTIHKWNVDNFGPLWVPARGATVKLTAENISLYERIIDVYEEHDLKITPDGIYIDGSKTDSYTFKMNYYFMMGDNRHNSADSRYWGFVPEDHVVGKPSFIWFSKDKDKSFFGGIRWSRIFSGIK